MEPAYRYNASCERVIDGDTYVLRVDLGFRAALTIDGRLHGVNTPELDTPEGEAAATYVTGILTPDAELVIESYKDQQSFARWIVDVYLPDGRSLADVLVESGHAVRQ